MSRVIDQHLGQCQLSCPPLCLPSRGLEAASWAQIHQNLQEFARGTQVVSRAWPEAHPHTEPSSWLVSPTPGRAGAGNIMVIKVYAPTSNTEEAEVEWFCEDLQEVLEPTPKKDVLFII